MKKLVTKISQVFEVHFKGFVTLQLQSQKKKKKRKNRKIRATIVKTVENIFKGHPAKMKFFKSDSIHVDKNSGSTIATFTMVLEIFLPEVV